MTAMLSLVRLLQGLTLMGKRLPSPLHRDAQQHGKNSVVGGARGDAESAGAHRQQRLYVGRYVFLNLPLLLVVVHDHCLDLGRAQAAATFEAVDGWSAGTPRHELMARSDAAILGSLIAESTNMSVHRCA